MEISIVTPTLGRPAQLARVRDHLERQTVPPDLFEWVVVADAKEEQPEDLDAVLEGSPFAAKRLQAERPGASAARNAGWRAAAAPVVLFLDDDVFPEPALVEEHLSWHRHHPEDEVGVLGRLRWADELRVTPFMRWVENGIHFDFKAIEGTEAGWGRFYTANASVKRALIEAVGGFDDERLPFLYEDLDLALRMHERGFRLLYNSAAVAEHLHPMDLDYWKKRVARIAVSERTFVELHPEVPPYYRDMFAAAKASPPARGRAARLVGIVPREFPWLGRRVWKSAEVQWLKALADPFLDAWDAAAPRAELR
jgi:GT2 family glycosyltransferase